MIHIAHGSCDLDGDNLLHLRADTAAGRTALVFRTFETCQAPVEDGAQLTSTTRRVLYKSEQLVAEGPRSDGEKRTSPRPGPFRSSRGPSSDCAVHSVTARAQTAFFRTSCAFSSLPSSFCGAIARRRSGGARGRVPRIRRYTLNLELAVGVRVTTIRHRIKLHSMDLRVRGSPQRVMRLAAAHKLLYVKPRKVA